MTETDKGADAHVGERRQVAVQEPRRYAPLSAHILPTSATMIGVCMTVLTIGRLGPYRELHVLVDKLLALDALMFLSSSLLSFLSMRARQRGARYESYAESVFTAGLGVLTLAAVLVAFAIR